MEGLESLIKIKYRDFYTIQGSENNVKGFEESKQINDF